MSMLEVTFGSAPPRADRAKVCIDKLGSAPWRERAACGVDEV